MFVFKAVDDDTLSEIYHSTAADIFEDSFFSDYGLDDFWKKDDEGNYYLIELNTENIGVCSFNFDEDGVIIDILGLLPEYRKKGMGKKVIKQLEEEFLEDVEWCEVEFIADDTNLFNFYYSAGFRVERIEVFVYEDGEIVFQGTFLEFLDEYEEDDLPDFVPWVSMRKEY